MNYTGIKQHHLTISVFPEQWDKIVYDASATGKKTSRYICDKVLEYIAKNGIKAPEYDYSNEKGDKHIVKPLSFYEEDYQFIRGKAKASGMKQSEYIRNIVLYY